MPKESRIKEVTITCPSCHEETTEKRELDDQGLSWFEEDGYFNIYEECSKCYKPPQLWTFKECYSCGAGVQSRQVKEAPDKYYHTEEYKNDIFYCLGTADQYAFCMSCGAHSC